ncbi:MAG: immune inhibitor A [Candidatus Eisenbacteria bacterium]|nr:immune inhibitor A [Candidatus Eisenbacteria bacterium]
MSLPSRRGRSARPRTRTPLLRHMRALAMGLSRGLATPLSRGLSTRSSRALMGGFVLACATIAVDSASAAQLVRVSPQSKQDYSRILEIAPEAGSCGATRVGSALEFVADPAAVAGLQADGLDVEIVIDDLEAYYESRLQGGGLFGEYHTYTEAIDAMDALVAAYPTLISPKFSIGQTLEGREMWVYKISDNPTIDEDEPEIFFNAYIHAREVITFEILYAMAQELLSGYGSDPEMQARVDGTEIFILPVVNPDGVEYNATTNPGGGGLWRKNRRVNGGGSFGVDLNRNFGFNWGYDNIGSSPSSSSDTYRGPSAFSEQETQAVRDFVLSRNFSIVINYHSYSNLEIFAYEFDNVHAPDYDEHLALARSRRETSGYGAGSTWEILYIVNGGANDWAYEEAGAFAILTEVGGSGDGFWPLESRIPALVAENLPGCLRMIDLADDPLRALPPAIPAITNGGTVGSDFVVQWETPNPDPHNPPVGWNVLEATGHTVGADDLEAGADTRFELDGFTVSTSNHHSGARALWGGAADASNHIAVSQRGYEVGPGDELRFWTTYSIESGYDYGYVEVSTDSHSFEPIAGSITTASDPQGRNLGNGITGNSGWVQATFDLGAYEGETVWFRFRYCTDGGVTNSGWYIDDIEPSHLFATETVVAEGVGSPEYLVENQPSGTYTYLVQGVDADGQTSPWSPPVDFEVGSSVSVDDSGLSDRWTGLRLEGRHPIRGAGSFSFQIPADLASGELVSFRIVDVLGRTVNGPLSGRIGEGWGRSDGLLSSRNPLVAGAPIEVGWAPQASGSYFALLRVGRLESAQRVIVID